jgi:hypothetical protein
MYYRLAADCIVVLHVGFVCFVVAGGLLVIKQRWVAALHLPAAVWGALVEFQGWYCPLTPLEQRLRQAAGQAGYRGGFVEHYLMPVLYPAGLEREVQMLLGTAVVAINLAVYAWILARPWVRGENN